MLEPEESLSTDMIEVRVGRDVSRPILLDMLFPLSLQVILKSSLVFVLKTPEIFM